MSKIDGGLRGLFRHRMPDIMWTTIETGATSPGTADSNYLSSGGIEGWVEHKQTDGWAVKFRPGQVPWLDRRARLGGRVWIAVRRRRPGAPSPSRFARQPTDELWLLHGSCAAVLAQAGLVAAMGAAQCEPQARGHMWPGGPAGWDWDAVRRVLLAGG